MTRRMLGRVPWWAWAGIVWAGGLVVFVVVWVRVMGRRPEPFTPQIDDPIRRALRAEVACPFCGDTHPGLCDEYDEQDGPPRPPGIPAEVPDPLVYGLPGAIHALGMATDETTARYWLAVCARRGADADLLARLWDAWRAASRDSVRYLYTDNRPEDDDL